MPQILNFNVKTSDYCDLDNVFTIVLNKDWEAALEYMEHLMLESYQKSQHIGIKKNSKIIIEIFISTPGKYRAQTFAEINTTFGEFLTFIDPLLKYAENYIIKHEDDWLE